MLFRHYSNFCNRAETLLPNDSPLLRLFSLKHDFPNEWHKYVDAENDNFTAIITKEYFPYLAQGLNLEMTGFQLFEMGDENLIPLPLAQNEIVNTENPLEPGQKLRHTLNLDAIEREGEIEIISELLSKEKDIFLLLRYIGS